MLYVKVDEDRNPVGIPFSERILRRVEASVLLPATLTQADVAVIGYEEVPEDVEGIERVKFHNVVMGVPVRGDDGLLKRTYVNVPYKEGELEYRWRNLRRKRTALLLNSDRTQLQDAPLSEAARAAWAAYRQALRDLPLQSDDPQFVVWPTEPKE